MFRLIFAKRVIIGPLHINFFKWAGYKITFRINWYNSVWRPWIKVPRVYEYKLLGTKFRYE